jgi:uncharacterized MAPEG superfamily protein
MTPELLTLALAALLQGVQFVLYAVPANRDLGPGYTTSARDRPPSREMRPLTGRMGRAMDNHFEALILHTIAVVVIILADRTTVLTAILGWTFLGARILYVPAYAFGWRPGRSVIWIVGFGATMSMLIAALL